MKQCIIVGSGSDIARELGDRLKRDGWRVISVAGHETQYPTERWDLLILAHGQLSPIDRFFEAPWQDWQHSLQVNAFAPLHALRTVWPRRNHQASVVFISGPNMAKDSPTYTAYRAGKAILESLVGTLNAEYPDTNFLMLRPGVVNTKIHNQTIQAGKKAANYERVLRIVNGKKRTVTHDHVYSKLLMLLEETQFSEAG